MFALTAEGWIVVGTGLSIVAVCLVLFVVRGDRDAEASTRATKMVQFSAPASLVGMALGALLVLAGTGFLSLGGSGGDDEGEWVSPPITSGQGALPPDTTTTTMPPTTTSTIPESGISTHGDHLAFTGGGTTILAGFGIMAVSAGTGFVGRSYRLGA